MRRWRQVLARLSAGTALVSLVSGWAVLGACAKGTDEFRLSRVAVDRHGGGDATIAPDGRRFVTTSRRAGHWDLWVFDLETSSWEQVTDHPADDFEARWSPDGERLVFTSTRDGGKNVWILNLASDELSQLTDSEFEDEYPAWSPDGREVVFTGGPWGQRDYFVVPAGGGQPRRITRESGRAGACAFDPSGESLLCHRYDLGSGDVLRVWLDGEMAPLTLGSAWDYKPTPSSDGHWAAFSRSTEGPSGIAIMPATGGRVRMLTESPHSDRWPTWTGSGHTLLFHRFVERGVAVKEFDRTTGETRTLVEGERWPLQATLHPSREELVYCAVEGDRKVLRWLDLESGATRDLNTGAGQACFPRWSPSGDHLAFAGKTHARWEIGLMEADGSGLLQLTAGTDGLRGMDGPIDWAPDGRRILFQADTEAHEASLYTVDVETREVTRITGGGWFDESPSWADGGRSVLFMSTRGGDWTWSVLKMNLADSSMTTLAGPDWIEKNFPREGRGGTVVWSVRDEAGNRRVVERQPSGAIQYLSAAGDDALWPSVSRDGERVVYTVIEHSVEYWLAENVFGRGSPLRRPAVESPRLAGLALPAGPAVTVAASGGISDGPTTSPVDLGRR